jgi:hypothetical protein
VELALCRALRPPSIFAQRSCAVLPILANIRRTVVFGARCLRGCLEGEIMTSKHPKQKNPSDADLHRNPLIGGSKGTTMAHVTPEELEQLEGVNTIEGDVENDTNPLGGIDKAKVRNARRRPPDHGREPGPHIAKSLHLSKNQAKGAGSGGYDRPARQVDRRERGAVQPR